MQKKNRQQVSMDGFVRRDVGASGRQIGQPANPGTDKAVSQLGRASMLASSTGTAKTVDPTAGSGRGIRRGELDDSLKAIDGDKKKPNKNDPYVRARKRKVVKRIVIAILILLLLAGGYVAVRAFINSSKVFQGNIFEAITQQNTPLAKDSYGHTNVLLFGTSEDDGPSHGGATLTDSIMILSIDQEKKTSSLLSIPRDLWVQYDKSCAVGYAGKINATYYCALLNNNNDENAASEAFVQKVDEIFGADIQYYVHVNYTVVRDVVDAVGGVDITIQGSDSRGILDRNFDWTCNYKCYLVKYPNGPAHLDGTHALALARARNDAGGYGLSRGNFDREQNQQKILKAVQAKALSGGTLANPVAVLNLMNSLGDNIKTNFQTKEITTLVNLAKEIKTDNIKSLDIASEDNPLVTTGTGPDGSSIVRPVAGLLDYSGLQAYAKAVWSGDTSALENATIGVYNGSQTPGVASTKATELKKAGFNVVATDDAMSDYTTNVTLYDLTGGKKPATLSKLQKQLNVTVTAGKPVDFTSGADFVVVLGTPKAATSTQ